MKRKRINQMSSPKREEIKKTKPDIKSNEKHKQDIKMIKLNLTSSSKNKTN